MLTLKKELSTEERIVNFLYYSSLFGANMFINGKIVNDTSLS